MKASEALREVLDILDDVLQETTSSGFEAKCSCRWCRVCCRFMEMMERELEEELKDDT